MSQEKSPRIPLHLYIRSADQECQERLQCLPTSGSAPKWISGSLMLNGPGMRHINGQQFNHVFDGMAFMQKIDIRDGNVWYSSRFLRSDAFCNNIKHGKIVVSEFGTRAPFADPSRCFCQRLTGTMFLKNAFSDNCCITFCKIGDTVFAVTDGTFVRQINPLTLQTLGPKIDAGTLAGVHTLTSHTHYDDGGHTYVLGTGSGCYKIFEYGQRGLSHARVVARVSASRLLLPSYIHSFAMTQRYFIMIEQPLVIDVLKMIKGQWFSRTSVPSDVLSWRPEFGSRFHVIDRQTGQRVKTVYRSDPFLFFHTVNAYEDSDHLIIDLITYDDSGLVQALAVSTIRQALDDAKVAAQVMDNSSCSARRFVLPLLTSCSRIAITRKKQMLHGIPCQTCANDNLVQLPDCSAQAILVQEKVVWLRPQILTERAASCGELPAINYDRVNGCKYSFFYGIRLNQANGAIGVMKQDVTSGQRITWNESGCYASEPAFIAKPCPESEDDGVVLSLVMREEDERSAFIVILDAHSLDMIARCDFTSPGVVTSPLHGVFLHETQASQAERE